MSSIEEESRQFILQLLNLFSRTFSSQRLFSGIGKKYICGLATNEKVYNALELALKSELHNILNDVKDINCNIIRYAIYPPSPPKVVCREIISNRKTPEEKIRKISLTRVPLLTREEKIKIIETLLTCEGKKNFKRLKKALSLRSYDFFFSVEQLIKVYAKLESPQEEEKLLDKWDYLLDRLCMRGDYSKLFRPTANRAELLLLNKLPNVLSNIIIDYTRLSCLDLDDGDEIFQRISKS